MITYLVGDATDPCKKPAAILHICNNVGGWGAGFVNALSARWKQPENTYRFYSQLSKNKLQLGVVQPVQVEPDITVFNLIAQDGFRNNSNLRPVNYGALAVCLWKVSERLSTIKASYSIHMPRIGCGLGGGEWRIVEPLIEDAFKNHPVFVYDLEVD